MIDKVIKKSECCGCFGCLNSCPKNCIQMKDDNEGFWYPEVDYFRCIKCNLCIKNCPALNIHNKNEDVLKEVEVIAAYSKDEVLRLDSTSGGIFSEIAKYFIKEKGIVYGAIYNQEHLVEHYRGTTVEDIDKLRQSKYLQSNIGDIYRKVKEDLINKKKVLFVGTPCHIAALNNYLSKNYDNLTTIDFLCRGINSPEAYKQYLKNLEKKYFSKIKRVIFKNKTYGWHRFSTKIIFENGQEYIQDRYTDSYMRGYLEGNLFMRPSCHECRYKSLPRHADITLGDFWGIEKVRPDLDQDKGTSIFMLNTEKGKKTFESIKERIVFEKMKLNDIYLGNTALTQRVLLTKKQQKMREIFFKNYKEKDFENLVLELLYQNRIVKFLKKIKSKVKRFLVG